MSTRPKTGYIPTLDGWRAIAIGMVLLAHAPIPGGVLHLGQLQIPLAYGNLGVDLFFAISGLLICSRLLEEERIHGSISLRGFYIRRSFRIFPAAYVYLLVVALVGILHVIPMDWPAWGSAVAFVRNYFTCLVRDTPANRFTGHFWSLAIEEHFYLVLPSLLVFFPKYRKLVLLSLTIAAFLWLAIYVYITPVDLRSIYWERRTDLRIGSLLLPAWIALFMAEAPTRKRLAKWFHPGVVALVLLALLGCLVAKKYFFPHHVAPDVMSIVQSGDYTSPVHGGPVNLIQNVLAPFLFPLCVVSTILYPNKFVGRFLEWRPLRAIGRVSYSLYLWQQLFWVLPYRGWPIARVQQPLIGMLFVLSAAIASYFLVEKPLMRLGHRLAPPSTPGHRDLDAAPSHEVA